MSWGASAAAAATGSRLIGVNVKGWPRTSHEKEFGIGRPCLDRESINRRLTRVGVAFTIDVCYTCCSKRVGAKCSDRHCPSSIQSLLAGWIEATRGDWVSFDRMHEATAKHSFTRDS